MGNGDGAREVPAPGGASDDKPNEKLTLGPVQLSTGQAKQAARSAGRTAASASRSALRLGNEWVGRLRAHANQRRRPQPGHRPDGTLVAPSPPAVVRSKDGAGGPLTVVSAPFAQAVAAVRERWQDAVREGKLAAREKEAQIRADYEARVRHSPRLHAEQHNLQERRRD